MVPKQSTRWHSDDIPPGQLFKLWDTAGPSMVWPRGTSSPWFQDQRWSKLMSKSHSGWWLTYPCEKWWTSSIGMMKFPTEWKKKKCSKPPTSVALLLKSQGFCWSFIVFVAEIRLNPSSLWLKSCGKAARPLLTLIESPSMSPLGMAGAGTWQASEWGVSTSFCWGFYKRTWRLIILIIDNGMIMILPPGTAPKSKKWIPQLQKWKKLGHVIAMLGHGSKQSNIRKFSFAKCGAVWYVVHAQMPESSLESLTCCLPSLGFTDDKPLECSKSAKIETTIPMVNMDK